MIILLVLLTSITTIFDIILSIVVLIFIKGTVVLPKVPHPSSQQPRAVPGLGRAGRHGGAATRKRGGSKMDLAGIEFTGIFHFFLLQCVPAPLPQVFEKYISDIHIF